MLTTRRTAISQTQDAYEITPLMKTLPVVFLYFYGSCTLVKTYRILNNSLCFNTYLERELFLVLANGESVN